MVATVSNNFKTEFDQMVKHDAQDITPRLPGLCRMRRGNSKTFTFNRMGTMLMQERTGYDPFPLQNVNQDNVVVNVTDYFGYTISKEEDLDKINYDEKKELAIAAKMAYANMIDQLIINELENGASATIEAGGTGVTWLLSDFVDLVNAVRQQSVTSDLYYVCSYTTHGKMQQVTEVASSDYSNGKPLESGVVGTYMGVKILPIPDLITTVGSGLPITSGDRTNYLVAAGPTGSIGWASSRDVTTRVAMLEDRDAWKVGLKFSGAAKAIGSLTPGREGIYKHIVDEAV